MHTYDTYSKEFGPPYILSSLFRQFERGWDTVIEGSIKDVGFKS
jgi:hypothetical protein